VIDPRRIIMVAALLGAVGIWLLLPRGKVRGRLLGLALGAVGLGLLASQMPGLGDWVAQSLFAVLAAVTVVSAAAAITLRNPVYCAIWFGMSLLGTAGLLLFQGAQFLAVATVVVYAGAILVIFLFLLMLAEPGGRAPYDRVTWEGLVSAFAGAFIAGILSMTVTSVLAPRAGSIELSQWEPVEPPVAVTDQQRQQGILADNHMQQIGGALFDGRQPTREGQSPKPGYLIAVEVAGVLLLAALVGAAVIVGRGRQALSGPRVEPAGSPSPGGPPDE